MLLWVYKIVSQNGSQLIRCACDAEWIEGKKAIDTCLHFFFQSRASRRFEQQRACEIEPRREYFHCA